MSAIRCSIAIVVSLVVLSSHSECKDVIPTPENVPVLGEFEPILIDAMLRTGNRDATLSDALRNDAVKQQIRKHKLQLFGGPMLGKVTDSSASIWVRTDREAEVRVVLFRNKDMSEPIRSAAVRSSKDRDLTAVVDLTGLKPMTTYYYDVSLDGKNMLGPEFPSFRTFPSRGQKAKFDVGFGGGSRLVPQKERIWQTIASFKPAAFLFLGDNLYIDKPTQRNLQRLYYYRRQLRPEFRRLTSGTSIYAIWDDHDFGKNDCSGGPDPFRPEWKVPVWRVFRENWNNPYYGGGEKQPGCWFDFSIGDVDFFMTDGRYYRSFKDGTMLGPVQKKWLLNKLKESKATFKVIASGTLWTETADKGGKDSWWGVKEEREDIFSLIDREEIGGVILLSADRHRTDVYQIKRPNGYTLYEFETSKLTNNHTHGTKDAALFSYNKGNFFGMLTFDLTKSDPEVTFRCITIDGEQVYSLTLQRSQLERSKGQLDATTRGSDCAAH